MWRQLPPLMTGRFGKNGRRWHRGRQMIDKTTVRGLLAATLVACAVSAQADVFNTGGTISGGTRTGLASLSFVPVGNPGNSANTADTASLLYEQPANSPGGIASQNAPNWFGSLYTGFDNFTLATGASITGVQWQGSYSATPVYPITQFELIFWSNNAGLPGQALMTYDISGNGGEQFVAV